MKLTSFTDYSLRLLMYVAVNNDRLVSIREVAEVFEISRNHLMKIVHELGKGGYLKTVRGKNGGFRLGMPAKNINLGKLIRYTEDDLNVVECFNDKNPSCKIISQCMLANILQMALNSFLDVLDGHNLEDLIENLHFPEFIPDKAIGRV
ncbi:MAG: Rrf2 family transcriptional regulator [Alphaproteobacteria bacterium]|nr:MAG: Rrf2 family transcriptional regulator [Alphaproteobacteria bacterium]